MILCCVPYQYHSLFTPLIYSLRILAKAVYNFTGMCPWWWDGVEGQGFIFIALTLLPFLWFILGYTRKFKSKYRSLPGPCGLPLVGYLPFLGTDLRLTFKDLATIYGPIFKVQLGVKECIVVSSPSHAKEILREQDVIFAHRSCTVAGKIAGFGASDLALCDYSPEWRKLRKFFVSGMLNSVNIGASFNLRNQHVKAMISKTYRRAGEIVDVGELVFFTTFSSIMSMVWGDTVKGEGGEDIHRIDSDLRYVIAEFILQLGIPNISDYLPFLACLDLQGVRRKMKSVADRIERVFDAAIDNHFASKDNNQTNFLGYLLQLTKLNDPAESVSVPQVKGILMDAIVGGMDTTAITVEWAMAEVLKHPKVMRKVQEELDETVGLNNRVDEIHIPKLKYLNAVLKETLRLHPAVALLVPHCSSMATTVGGYTVQNNSMVFINTWAIHRDPNLWEHPLEFKPERFLNDSETLDLSGNQFKYLPFGSGRRMCPGLILAEKMSMSMLSSLLHSFEWKLPDGVVKVDLSDRFGLVVKKSKPTMAVPSPRLSKLDLYD